MSDPVEVSQVIAEENPDVVILFKNGDLTDIYSQKSELKFLFVNYDKGTASTYISSSIEMKSGFINMPEGRYKAR